MFEYIHKFVKNISFTIDKQLTEEYTWKQLKQDDFYTREDIDMAKEVKQAVAEPEVNTAEWLEQKMAKMKEAQKIFATYTQEQVDKIFFEAAMAANKARIPLAKMAA